MNPSQDFGAAFRAQRLAAGFTQAALAQRAGCRRQTIVAIEAGQNIELCTLLAALSAMGKELGLPVRFVRKPATSAFHQNRWLGNEVDWLW